jgi:uncharacterized membrane protein
MVLLISSTLVLGVITGFVSFSEVEFLRRVAGQVIHGLLSFACFALVGVTFWRLGWKVGVTDLGLLLIVSNIACRLSRYPQKRSGLRH